MALASDEVNPTVSVTEPTRFQLASTALTVTLNGASAVSAVGVPVLPVAVPGEAVSPGINSCSFAKAPAFTVTLAVVYPVNPVALAVMVRVPAVLKVKLDRAAVPPDKVTLPVVAPLSSAMAALASELVRVTLVVAVAITFQLTSTALTTMPLRIAVPAVWAEGEPVFPVADPGEAVSPGNRTSSLVTGPAFTVMAGLVLA